MVRKYYRRRAVALLCASMGFQVAEAFAIINPKKSVQPSVRILHFQTTETPHSFVAFRQRGRPIQSSVAKETSSDSSKQRGPERGPASRPEPVPEAAVEPRPDTDLLIGLAFLSGWVDAVSLKLYGCYVTMMTGPVVNIALALADASFAKVRYFALIIGAYMCGASLYRFLELRRDGQRMPLAVAPLLLGLFVATDLMTLLFPSSRLPGLLLACGYGLINTLSLGVCKTITCMLTGHMQNVGNAVVDTALGRSLGAARERILARSSIVLAAFVAGVSLSALSRNLPVVAANPLLHGFSLVGLAYALLFWEHDSRRLWHSENYRDYFRRSELRVG